MSVYRLSRHPMVRWWWEMDKVILSFLAVVLLIGVVAVSTASVGVSKTFSVAPYHFAMKQYVFLTLSCGVMLFLTLLKPSGVKRLGLFFFLLAFAGIVATHFAGIDVKGASRWISVFGQRLQPTELMKPALVILTAWILAWGRDTNQVGKSFIYSMIATGMVLVPVLLQPDFGMFLLMSCVWGAQVILAGIPLMWILPLIGAGLGGITFAYLTFDHVRSRVARFLNPEQNDTYQVDQASEAILSGHLFGRGAGEGVVKHTLPDAHTDFIFAVIVEEFGLLVAFLLLFSYMAIVFRGFVRLLSQENEFVLLAGGGLLSILALQATVNMGVALNVLPTTGMTLPFISYGGSATLGMAILVGFVLSLVRRRQRTVLNRKT